MSLHRVFAALPAILCVGHFGCVPTAHYAQTGHPGYQESVYPQAYQQPAYSSPSVVVPAYYTPPEPAVTAENFWQTPSGQTPLDIWSNSSGHSQTPTSSPGFWSGPDVIDVWLEDDTAHPTPTAENFWQTPSGQTPIDMWLNTPSQPQQPYVDPTIQHYYDQQYQQQPYAPSGHVTPTQPYYDPL